MWGWRGLNGWILLTSPSEQLLKDFGHSAHHPEQFWLQEKYRFSYQMPRFRSAALFYIQYPEGYDTVYQYQSDCVILPKRTMCTSTKWLRNPSKAKSTPLAVLYKTLLENFEHFTLPYIPYLIPRFMCFYSQRLSTTHVTCIPNQTCSRCAGGLQTHCLSCFPQPGEPVSLIEKNVFWNIMRIP